MAERQPITSNGLETAQKFFGLQDTTTISGSKTPIADAIFVAIDFEQLPHLCQQDTSSNLDTQTGLAILDSRKIMTKKPSRVISTRNFVSGSPKYCAKARRDFLFGQSINIEQREILENIQSSLSSFKGRSIILVGHHITGDLAILQGLGYDFQPVVAVLDTLWIATKSGRKAASLKDYLIAEGCDFDKLHCAGNDANFTLRLLLLLVARSSAESAQAGSVQAQCRAKLEEIALSPIQHRADPHVKAAKKKLKWKQRSRKYQSKFWDIDKQNEIRAERAARRQEALDNANGTSNAQSGVNLTQIKDTACQGSPLNEEGD